MENSKKCSMPCDYPQRPMPKKMEVTQAEPKGGVVEKNAKKQVGNAWN